MKTAKQTNDRNKQTYQRSSGRGIVTDPSKIWVTRLNAALAEGYDYQVGGYLELLSYAHQQGAEGWLELDRTVTKEEIARMSQRPRNIVPGTAIVQDLSGAFEASASRYVVADSDDSRFAEQNACFSIRRLSLFPHLQTRPFPCFAN